MMLKIVYRTAAVAALVSLPLSASALGISVTETTTNVQDAQTDFQTQLGKLVYFTIEDFETQNVGQGDFGTDKDGNPTKTLGTNVGDMTFSGDPGAGGAAIGDDTFGRIADTAVYGRKNTSTKSFGGDGITDVTHDQYLESNDVQTMTWTAKDNEVADREFDRLLFSITDAADSGAKFVISDGTDASPFEYVLGKNAGSNNEIRNFVVSFDTLQSSATVEFTNMSGNVDKDGVGFDNMVVGAVPLPAAAWLLLGVSGALVGAKRRSARKAA